MSMKPMEYASVVTPDQDHHQGIESTGPKIGHKCCGACCDMRRAVIICDIILLVGGIFSLCFEGFAVYGASAILNMDDDAFQGDDATAQNYKESMEDQRAVLQLAEDAILVLMVMTIITLFATGASVWGALNYNYWPVAVNAVCLGLRAIIPLFMGSPSILGVVIAALWIYPHVFFCFEVRSGVLCRETYGREEFSCCCISKRIFVSAPGVPVAEAEMV